MKEEKLWVYSIDHKLPIEGSPSIQEILNKEMTEIEIVKHITDFRNSIVAEITLYSVPKRLLKEKK